MSDRRGGYRGGQSANSVSPPMRTPSATIRPAPVTIYDDPRDEPVLTLDSLGKMTAACAALTVAAYAVVVWWWRR